jgi:hypothetical protein
MEYKESAFPNYEFGSNVITYPFKCICGITADLFTTPNAPLPIRSKCPNCKRNVSIPWEEPVTTMVNLADEIIAIRTELDNRN